MRFQSTIIWLRQNLENIRSSLWFVPSLSVSALTALAFGLLVLDHNFGSAVDFIAPWAFGGHSSAARDLLSTIATAAVAIVSVSFSITVVALQLASTQYTPRVLRNFLRDLGVQIVLGIYIGTFSYSLVVLRAIREADGDQDRFVPSLAIMVAMLLALVCVGCLVYFIHHVSQTLQAGHLIADIREELDRELKRFLKEPAVDRSFARQFDQRHEVRPLRDERRLNSNKDGHLRSVQFERLLNVLKTAGVKEARVCQPIGQFLNVCSPIITIGRSGPLPDDFDAQVRACFLVQRQRTVYQDALYAVRQIVDIAVKALSPSINDPTTAEQCIFHLGAAFAKVLNEPFPSDLISKSHPRLSAPRLSFDQLLKEGFWQIIAVSRGHEHVQRTLINEVEQLLTEARVAARRESIKSVLVHMADDVRAPVALDRNHLLEKIDRALIDTGTEWEPHV